MNKDQAKGKEVSGKIVGDRELELKGKIQNTLGEAQAALGDVKSEIKAARHCQLSYRGQRPVHPCPWCPATPARGVRRKQDSPNESDELDNFNAAADMLGSDLIRFDN